jgi:FkbM family methyltransferase
MLKKMVYKLLHFFGYELYKFPSSDDIASLKEAEKIKREEEQIERSQAKLQWLINKGVKTILDIGANTGQAAATFRKIFPEAKIYSFEPLPDCYQELTDNFKDVPLFQAFNIALGDSFGKIVFNRNEYSPSSSLLTLADNHKTNFPFAYQEVPQEVEIKRLDDMVEELEICSPMLIKIDVQGFEDKVIDGGLSIISKADAIIIEMSVEILYEGQVLFDGLYTKLKGMGFNYHGNYEQLCSPEDGRVLQMDSIFVKD